VTRTSSKRANEDARCQKNATFPRRSLRSPITSAFVSGGLFRHPVAGALFLSKQARAGGYARAGVRLPASTVATGNSRW
jgi:hypothetical protein